MDEAWFTKARIYRYLGGGLLAFCILSILLMAGPIARDAERRTLENLKIAGFDWAEVERYGRGMAIKGVAPSKAEGEAAVEVAGDDWSVRDAWGEYELAPGAAEDAKNADDKESARPVERPVLAAAAPLQAQVQTDKRGVAQ